MPHIFSHAIIDSCFELSLHLSFFIHHLTSFFIICHPFSSSLYPVVHTLSSLLSKSPKDLEDLYDIHVDNARHYSKAPLKRLSNHSRNLMTQFDTYWCFLQIDSTAIQLSFHCNSSVIQLPTNWNSTAIHCHSSAIQLPFRPQATARNMPNPHSTHKEHHGTYIQHQYRNAGESIFKFLCGIPVDRLIQES